MHSQIEPHEHLPPSSLPPPSDYVKETACTWGLSVSKASDTYPTPRSTDGEQASGSERLESNSISENLLMPFHMYCIFMVTSHLYTF